MCASLLPRARLALCRFPRNFQKDTFGFGGEQIDKGSCSFSVRSSPCPGFVCSSPFLFACALLAAPFAHGATSNVAVSQVFAGGGNAGATYANDFVELFNRSGSAVDLTGWTVQYASASSTNWQVTSSPGRSPRPALPRGARIHGRSRARRYRRRMRRARRTSRAPAARSHSCATRGRSPAARLPAAARRRVRRGSRRLRLRNRLRGLRPCSGADEHDCCRSRRRGLRRHERERQRLHGRCAGSAEPPLAGGSLFDRVDAEPSRRARVDVDVQPVLSISLERSSLSFGSVVSGGAPAPISEKVTVMSNDTAGYALTVHGPRSRPATCRSGSLRRRADRSSRSRSRPRPTCRLQLHSAERLAGDVWPTTIGFTSVLPVVTRPLHRDADVHGDRR